MKNPLNRRLPRELKTEFVKYIIIFLFLTIFISIVSGFLVADNSMYTTYNQSFKKYNIENGNFVSGIELDNKKIKEIEEKNNIKIYNLYYRDLKENSDKAKYRIFSKRDDVNKECIMSGKLPENKNEIAIDRMFSDNTGIVKGDKIRFGDNELIVSGLIALPDYSCLFESNSDMIFDATHFSVAIMTEDGFNSIDKGNPVYSYAYEYDKEPRNDMNEKKISDDLLENLKKDVILTSFTPRLENKAITFSGDDLGKDKIMFLIFSYIVILIIAFVFAVTTSNTIIKEAGTIGTLRASGYTKMELVRHYMILPIIVTLVAGIIGNILGYTYFEKKMAGLYYGSYSLTKYEVLLNTEAFIATTLVPIILMFLINFIVLYAKLRISPIKFIRRDLTTFKRKKAINLSTLIPFLHRFRIRIIVQNISSYIVLFIGIVFASILVVFGTMFSPLLDDYANDISNSMFSNYQYVLKYPVEVKNSDVEKYSVTMLTSTQKDFISDDITIYGIEKNSKYINLKIPKGKVYLSSGIMKKYSLNKGDTIKLREKYENKYYKFTIAGEYKYDAVMSVFMNKEDFNKRFDKPVGYFNGYFSNKKIDNLDKNLIATIITKDDLTKLSTQLKVSMGNFMDVLKWFGIVMFLLLMFLLSKQIIEKNTQSIAMVKILGFTNIEIARLYIIATTIVVILSLLVAIPVVDIIMYKLFTEVIYKTIAGYIPLQVSQKVYINMVIMGIVSYLAVSIIQLIKIYKVPKNVALKNIE
ncbi:ABC transporter permease [Peptostreptococcus canis]|nr:ABC transporter permease [Peptostreptococcus canis]MBP1997205.1 putative ABC transport system permease protein [Peptostreptococcus canis]